MYLESSLLNLLICKKIVRKMEDKLTENTRLVFLQALSSQNIIYWYVNS